MASRKTTTTVEETEAEDTGLLAVERTPEPEPESTQQPQNGNVPHTFTEDEVIARIEAARQQEKDKLYPRLDEQDKALKALTADLEARQAAEAEAAKRAQDAEEARIREESDAKSLLAQAEERFNAELAAVRGELQTSQTLFDKERQFQALADMRDALIADANKDVQTIAPQVLKYVGGETEEEIRQSIAMAQETTASIVAEVQGAQQRQRQQAKGTSVTQPPIGPMETDQAFEMMSPEDIQNMDMATYAKRRAQLLQAASRAARPGAR